MKPFLPLLFLFVATRALSQDCTTPDTLAPVVIGQNFPQLTVPNTGTCTFLMLATDLVGTAFDNCTDFSDLQWSVRRTGAGTGFPVDASGNPVTFVVLSLPADMWIILEVWARDSSGNAGFGLSEIFLTDPWGNCLSPGYWLGGQVQTEDLQGGQGVIDVTVTLQGDCPGIPSFSLFQTTEENGQFLFSNDIPLDCSYTITPSRNDNPLNGVTTYDLVLIQRHILGLEPLNSPYKMIAADANKDGKITTFDIVALRKLIMGIQPSLPGNTSWRFVDKEFVFPDPTNPFLTAFPETISGISGTTSFLSNDMIGIKVGDVNGTAIPD